MGPPITVSSLSKMALRSEYVNGQITYAAGRGHVRRTPRARPGIQDGPSCDESETALSRRRHGRLTGAEFTGTPYTKGGDSMTNISMSELESQSAELLPEKETLLFDSKWAGVYAYNSSLAINAATLGSMATSGAWQTVVVNQ